MDWNFHISYFYLFWGAIIIHNNKFFFQRLNQLLEKKFSKYIDLFKKNEFYYYFIFRLTGGLGVPFFLQNALPVIFDMKKKNYFFSSLLGFVPSVFIFNTIGAGVNQFIKESDGFSFINLILSREIYIPISMFIIFILVSFLIKKKFFNVTDK